MQPGLNWTDSLDLGDLAGPLLIFGGPYSNLAATLAMRARAAALGIAPASVICTGDVVAYGAEPSETTDAIIDWGCHVVRGNCEESFGTAADDCGCGFDEGTACDVLSRQWYAYADARLQPAQRAWMRDRPGRIYFSMNGRRFAVLHGSAQQINEFVFAGTDAAIKRRDLDALGVDAVIGGHAGVPFVDDIDGRLWLNAGVIGMPANDATPRVWYAVLQPVAGGVRIHVQALDYDHAGAAAAMRRAGLPAGYADCLESGLWPNLDVMPRAERQATGRPLSPIDRIWTGRQVAAE